MTPRWLQNVYWIVCVGVFGFWGWGLLHASSSNTLWEPTPKGPAQEGKRVPPLKAQLASGQSTTLRAHRGKWILINFWATWCEPCRREMASLERLAQQMRPPSFSLWAVSVDANWNVVQQYFANHKELKGKTLKMKLLLDPQGAHALRYGTRKYPETYLIDPQGRLRKKWVGPFVWDSTTMVKQIKQMVANPTKGH